MLWEIETGWDCTTSVDGVADVCTEIWGDGLTAVPTAGRWDDNNTVNGDGCDSNWYVEAGWQWSGRSMTAPDVWIDICGDGIVVDPYAGYCDDDNFDTVDGCDATWAVERGWECTLGDATTASVCNEIWGDGIVIINTPTNWDDQNLVNGDGCSDACIVEKGWEWLGGTPYHPDSCLVVCGDGVLISHTEEWDDGDLESGDGCSATCHLEPEFTWINDESDDPATTWHEIWGDGLRVLDNDCDDGNTKNGDGWSSDCEREPGYSWIGGSSTSADMWEIVWGDGETPDFDPRYWDDNNTIPGDGWDSNWLVEPGWSWTKPDDFSAHSCGEKWGDGKLMYLECDDGNTQDGDGWSSSCTIETGFEWFNGTPTHRSECNEIWGDSFNYGGSEWDDGDQDNDDGCSSTCEYEKCWAWTGGSSLGPDTCIPHEFDATIGELSGDNNELYVTFSDTMYVTSIGVEDINVRIEADYRVDFSWSAEYVNSTWMKFHIDIKTAMEGTEVLSIIFVNYKTIRGINGGWPQPDELTTSISSSLSLDVELSEAISKYSKFLIIGGLLSMFGVVMLWAESLELIWSLVNTLQLICFLPLMINYYPEHVSVMFEILDFANLEIEYLADFMRGILHLNEIDAPSYDVRFDDYGIDSSLFLDNWASLISSLLISVGSLMVWVSVYLALYAFPFKARIGKIISSYFWNNFLRFFTEGYLEILFGALLNLAAFFHSTQLDGGDTSAGWTTVLYTELASFDLSKASLLISGLVAVAWVLFPMLTFTLLFDKKEEIMKGGHQDKYGTMFADFKLDKEWYTFQYYSMFLGRRLIFTVALIAGISFPMLQWNIFVFTSATVSSQIIIV